MQTAEVVKRLVELVNEGKNSQAQEELYHPDVVSYEQGGYSASGLEAVMAKTKDAFENIEEAYGGGVTQAFVGPESFILVFNMDVKPKGGERTQFTEYGFYKLKDGKVIEEHFYAEPFPLS